ncbi:hypothetical protein CFAM422_009680 [Trichoderma lentiforme]|uniref:Uncharacterized protein n=1 Tax=Trichoderma lentiforme TaxID=1567552 RepID=A0A9P4X9S2_9HYPO|nr:hypothetical protein CFAM422_009680 [Trichoderma lentiforme]
MSSLEIIHNSSHWEDDSTGSSSCSICNTSSIVISSPVRGQPPGHVRLTVLFGYGILLLVPVILLVMLLPEADAVVVASALLVVMLVGSGAVLACLLGGGASASSHLLPPQCVMNLLVFVLSQAAKG